MLRMSEIFRKAHKGAKSFVKKYGVDYRTQFAINVRYLIGKAKFEKYVFEYIEKRKHEIIKFKLFCNNHLNKGKSCATCKYKSMCKTLEFNEINSISDTSLKNIAIAEIGESFSNLNQNIPTNDNFYFYVVSCLKQDINYFKKQINYK